MSFQAALPRMLAPVARSMRAHTAVLLQQVRMKSAVAASETASAGASPRIPAYLQDTYWWAYLHPRAVKFFERPWLVNLILWGNMPLLQRAALDELDGAASNGRVLQVACVYGDFTENLLRRLGPQGALDVVDVAPIQLENLRAKLGSAGGGRTSMLLQDSSDLRFADGSHDAVFVFFLLHEQPAEVRRRTIAEALRVTKPGGRLVFVDYHKPRALNPFRYLMVPILTTLEPFAMDVWNNEVADWLPGGAAQVGLQVEKQTYFGGLYQKVVVTKPPT